MVWLSIVYCGLKICKHNFKHIIGDFGHDIPGRVLGNSESILGEIQNRTKI